MNFVLPPADTQIETVSFPRPSKDAHILSQVTEVTERSMFAMYDAMRGAQCGAGKTAPKRRAR